MNRLFRLFFLEIHQIITYYAYNYIDTLLCSYNLLGYPPRTLLHELKGCDASPRRADLRRVSSAVSVRELE